MLPPSSLCSVLLFVVTCLSYGVFCSRETLIDYRRPITVQITCCTAVSTAKLKFPIISYKIQSAANRCVNAIIFRTEGNGSFCANPKTKWVQKKVKELSGGTVQLPAGKKGNKGAKGGKRGKAGRKQNNKNKKKTKNNKKLPVTSPWFPSTAATTFQTVS
ncbi:PREDICTED: C-C motif chemokine 2-like [Nanorana parkeri]|uniref:C-C motif chemokine 2-like n=1 Tax=Nanorana parkeri TaxID=125878 RepID=UPI000853F30D|nr:PREDICTED: C-C motif chemokine 2-like [Nanorana parkeri]